MTKVKETYGNILVPVFKDYIAHRVHGKHGAFLGRRYRRGKLRCKFCGAPLNAPKGSGMPTEYPKLFEEASK